jgi:serine protease Do
MIAGMAPGTDVTISLWRDGAQQDVHVTLGTMPGQEQLASITPHQQPSQPAALEEFGLTLQPADGGQGVVVTEVKPDSDAAARGFQPGDVILSVGNTPVSSPSDVETQIADAKQEGLRAVLFRLQSENQPPRYIALPFGAA